MAQVKLNNLPPEKVKLIKELSEVLKPTVQEIENKKIKTTKNNYGMYLSLMSNRGSENKGVAKIIGLALIHAGANYNGVKSAWHIMGV